VGKTAKTAVFQILYMNFAILLLFTHNHLGLISVSQFTAQVR